MFGFIGRIFKSKDLQEHLVETKTIKLKGIIFKIKKIDVMDHLTGSKVMRSVFQTYEQNKDKALTEVNMKKTQEHLSDVILAGVVKPALCRNPEEGKILVSEIFNDWDLADALYHEIFAYTYGKKKMKKQLKLYLQNQS